MLSPRENAVRAVEFRSPAWLPCTLTVDLSWLRESDEAKRARIRELQARLSEDPTLVHISWGAWTASCEERDGVRRNTDQWGTRWRDDGLGFRVEEPYPLEAGYDGLAAYAWPELTPDKFVQADRDLAAFKRRYVAGCVWYTLFDRLWMLRGMEPMLVDMRDAVPAWLRLRDRIVEHDMALIDAWLTRDVQAVYFCEDVACQRGLAIAPDDWRRLFKPAYKRMFERVRAAGKHVWMHMCGDVTSILPDLVDLGLDVLNPVQPQAMDLGRLSRDFGGRLCFNGGVDVQGTLIRGTPADVKREVHDLVRRFGRFGGGYIGDTSHTIMPETPLDNVVAVFEAFLEYR